MRDSEGRCSNRVTSAFDDCAAFTARRSSFTSTRDASSLPRQLSSCHLKEPARERASTSDRRSSSQRASAASARARSRSARACCRSYSERQSRGCCSSTDAGNDQPASLPSACLSAAPISSSRTAMRSTIAHGKTRYQPNFRVHPDMDDEPNVGLYRPDRTFTSVTVRSGRGDPSSESPSPSNRGPTRGLVTRFDVRYCRAHGGSGR